MPLASLPAFSEIQSSSMVEHAAVNRGVVGSSPTSGAKFPKENGQLGRGLDKVITEVAQQGKQAATTC